MFFAIKVFNLFNLNLNVIIFNKFFNFINFFDINVRVLRVYTRLWSKFNFNSFKSIFNM